jgi:hypothetical protein
MKRLKWNFKKCQKLALKCKTRTEFLTKYKKAYIAAYRLRILDKICSHMTRLVRKDWTFCELLAESKKYVCKNEFAKNSSGAYQAAKLRGILKEICSHMPKRKNTSGENSPVFKWSDEKLQKEALKYKTRVDFQLGSPSAYRISANKHILDKICSHMKKSVGTSRQEQELFDILKKKYSYLIKKNFKVKVSGKPYIKGFQVDILDLKNKKGIEFDGKYHHSEEFLIKSKRKSGWTEEEAKNYHKIKDEALFDCYQIRLLHIKEQDWNKNKQECIDKCIEFLSVHA